MLIRATGTICHDGETIEPGQELHIQDEKAFELIRQSFAEPSGRRSLRVYNAMKRAYEAGLPKPGPDIRDQFVSAPKIDYLPPMRGGLIARINPFN
jgi:hypothetical protein